MSEGVPFRDPFRDGMASLRSLRNPYESEVVSLFTLTGVVLRLNIHMFPI